MCVSNVIDNNYIKDFCVCFLQENQDYTMACSSLNSAKYLKILSRYGEAELLSGLTLLKDDDQSQLAVITQKLHKAMGEIDSASISSKPKTKKRKIVTKQDLLEELLKKAEVALTQYEQTHCKKDVWRIDFEVGVDYSNLDFEDILNKHKKLIQSSLHAEQIKLLIYSERGRLYENLKFSEKWRKQWRSLCKELDVCHVTANRYIDYFRITNAYPRIMICNIKFETTMHLFSELEVHLSKKENYDLRSRLAQPLRTTSIKSKMTVLPDKLPNGGPQPTRLLSESSEWNAGWEVSDDIISRNDNTTESSSDEEHNEDIQAQLGIDILSDKFNKTHLL